MTHRELLEAALRGAETDWEQVHEACKDLTKAQALGRLLEESTTEENENAKAWANVLAEMHPGLNVKLPPAPLT